MMWLFVLWLLVFVFGVLCLCLRPVNGLRLVFLIVLL